MIQLRKSSRIAGRITDVRCGIQHTGTSSNSLVVGIAATGAVRHDVLVAGVGLVAGACAMAAGEYVSVSSQADTENADLSREKRELSSQPRAEEDELTEIYVRRGLDADLARVVARQLMAKDAFAAHTRDELGLTEELAARPLQAAAASAATFAVGAAVPVLTSLVAPLSVLGAVVSVASILCLVVLGAIAARAGGAPPALAATRVAFWGVAAMAATAAVGRLFGTPVG
jgi:VIT1/CCC1 family predicted Fe2+/Mn2+ transporter